MTTIESVKQSETEDEAQIIRELKGEILSTYIYSFQSGGRTVTSLSYAGVKRAIRKRGHYFNIPCECCKKAVHVDEDANEYRATVLVRDAENEVDMIGAASARKGQPFAYTLAVNKAERNAFRKMLNEKELAVLVDQYAKEHLAGPSQR